MQLFSAAIDCKTEPIFVEVNLFGCKRKFKKKAACYWLLLLATGLNKKSLLCTKCNQKFILICYWNIEKCVRFSGLAVMLVSWIFSFISFIFLFLRNCCLLFFYKTSKLWKIANRCGGRVAI